MRRRALLTLFLGLTGLVPGIASGHTLASSSALGPAVLSESVPTAFAPDDFGIDDFEIVWKNDPPPGWRAKLLPGSLQWTRVNEVLVLPRARIRIEADGISGGRATSSGSTQAFALHGDHGSIELPIALISGEANAVDIVGLRGNGNGAVRAQLWVQFHSRRQKTRKRVYIDPDCSRFGLTADAPPGDGTDWAYIGCRLVIEAAPEYPLTTAEVHVFWDSAGPEIHIGGAETQPATDSLWILRLRSAPGQLALQSGARPITLHYSFPDRFRRGYLGMGLGPYAYSFAGPSPEENVTTYAPELTLYASYFISESNRFVGFDATVFNARLNTDLGFYLDTESAKSLDQHLTISLLLGAHAIGFSSQSQYYLRVGAPQGAELIYRNFLKANYNLSAGAFVYPNINGKAYYNAWLRYGTRSIFGEFNYISWTEQINDQSVSSQSAGVSVGFPLTSFF